MKIIIDMQAMQAENKSRGIGRYALELTSALIRNGNSNKFILLLNGAFESTVNEIKYKFSKADNVNFSIWMPLDDIAGNNKLARARRNVSEAIREHSISAHKPDAILILSAFDGHSYMNSAVLSINEYVNNKIFTAVIHYDLIPLREPEYYLNSRATMDWFYHNYNTYKNADLFFSISKHSANELLSFIGNENIDKVITVYSGYDNLLFNTNTFDYGGELELIKISKPFVLCTAGSGKRKNISGLIQAFASANKNTGSLFQLVLAGFIDSEELKKLINAAFKCGIAEEDIIFTGYVRNAVLAMLYKKCSLFVFPSFNEGLGLPPIEAMACGAPVISSNRDALVEVVTMDEARFDPDDTTQFVNLMIRCFKDKSFRADLSRHGLNSVKRFSWDNTASTILGSLAQGITNNVLALNKKAKSTGESQVITKERKRLAYFSPVRPAKSGISDYSHELLPVLSKYYDIDVVSDQDECNDDWVNSNSRVISVNRFKNISNQYDRIIYQVGNSYFHKDVFELSNSHPGIVVLHDFYLGHAAAEINLKSRGFFVNTLVTESSWDPFYPNKGEEWFDYVMWNYPFNRTILESSVGIISHSKLVRQMAVDWFGSAMITRWGIVPHLRRLNSCVEGINQKLRVLHNRCSFRICSFGGLGSTKLIEKVIEAFYISKLFKVGGELIFVGELPQSEYRDSILAIIKRLHLSDHVTITGRLNDADYRIHLKNADIAIQLRTRSRGETSGAILDCLSYGVPTICNNHGTSNEIPNDVAIKIPDPVDCHKLSEKMCQLFHDRDLYEVYSKSALRFIGDNHNPEKCTMELVDLIEKFYEYKDKTLGLIERQVIRIGSVANVDYKFCSDSSRAISVVYPPPKAIKPTIYFDVSDIMNTTLNTGIQRVVNSVLNNFFKTRYSDYNIEPVYATFEHSYKFARRFSAKRFFRCVASEDFNDELIFPCSGDIFLSLDQHIDLQIHHRNWYFQMRAIGVVIIFMVYDLMPITHPQNFSKAGRFQF
ncbi:glycosyltransferase [Acidithiobacillus ferriphilus]|uniref:glycosyltransferase n=1 Tax=Acidithiobacillus ferriphilus TaxID=1689834 RepID=UPI001C06A4E0|nr:glycosyltransferase [Acidithiobacillus ferriphilus]MBU2854848.1 glycosyltransferase [Acidithiobacillus ferriphilus]